jgi:hypothetical protein
VEKLGVNFADPGAKLDDAPFSFAFGAKETANGRGPARYQLMYENTSIQLSAPRAVALSLFSFWGTGLMVEKRAHTLPAVWGKDHG